jgi:AraC-like DNA-binding protein
MTMSALQSRLQSTRFHDDGVDSWYMMDIAPPAQLMGLIDGYSDYAERTGSFSTRRELPHAQGVLVINLARPLEIVSAEGRAITLQAGEAFVAGPHLRAALSRSTGQQAGMHVFLPLSSVRRLVGVPMDRLLDQVIPLDALLGRQETSFCHALVEARDLGDRIKLLDAALTRRFTTTAALPQAQVYALSLLRDRPDLDISEVARAVGWSRKHLASRVHDAVGVGPRSWRRLIRFERLTKRLAATLSPDWAALAQEAGYYDQPHMIREFREFAGLTPGEHLSRSLPDGGGLIEC